MFFARWFLHFPYSIFHLPFQPITIPPFFIFAKMFLLMINIIIGTNGAGICISEFILILWCILIWLIPFVWCVCFFFFISFIFGQRKILLAIPMSWTEWFNIPENVFATFEKWMCVIYDLFSSDKFFCFQWARKIHF